jgi:hypothetical protein
MPNSVIEREIPGAGQLSPEDLQALSKTSCGVLHERGPQSQWVESVVADDKVSCASIAPSEAMILEHAASAGFPANRVSVVHAIIDPTTPETPDEHPTSRRRPSRRSATSASEATSRFGQRRTTRTRWRRRARSCRNRRRPSVVREARELTDRGG